MRRVEGVKKRQGAVFRQTASAAVIASGRTTTHAMAFFPAKRRRDISSRQRYYPQNGCRILLQSTIQKPWETQHVSRQL
jgi:hypothetical protein